MAISSVFPAKWFTLKLTRVYLRLNHYDIVKVLLKVTQLHSYLPKMLEDEIAKFTTDSKVKTLTALSN